MASKNNKINVKSNKKLLRTIVVFSVISLSSLFGVLASTFVSVSNVVNNNDNKNEGNGSILGNVKQTLGDIAQGFSPITEPVNILFLGSDIGYTAKGKKDDSIPTRSDSMILAHIDPKDKKVTALSIPRDTRVMMPEKNYYDKINAAFAYGGEKLARKVVANLTGLPIHHYLLLKVDGLMNIVDALGGVDIYIEKDMKYTDWTAKLFIKLKKGYQHLDGKQAHQYLRFRHDEIGDIGRVQRQQRFINAMTAKLINPMTILKLPQIVEIVQKNVVSDLSNGEMLKMGNFLRTIKKEDIKMVMLPGRFGEIGGASYWLTEEGTVKDTVKDLFPDSIFAQQTNPSDSPSTDPNIIDKKKYKLTVLNGTPESGLGAKAARVLREQGWTVWNIDQADKNIDRTQIILQTGKSQPAQYIASSLGVNPEIIGASIGELFTDYTIVIGKDFADVLKQKQDALDVKNNKQIKR